MRASGQGAPSGSGAEAVATSPDQSRLEAVLTGPDSAVFRAISQGLEGLDLSAPQGQRDALALGFNGRCTIAVRVLFATSENGETSLVRRHATLSRLNELRQYRTAYYNWHLRVDKRLTVPNRMEQYTVASMIDGGNRTVLDGWLNLELDTTDFIKAPHGVMGRLQYLDGRAAPVVHNPQDYFCQPALITKLCEFLHILACASGLAHTSDEGFTFVTFGEWYNLHLERAHSCPNMDSIRVWLERSVRGFKAALIAIKMRLRAILYNPAFAEPSASNVTAHGGLCAALAVDLLGAARLPVGAFDFLGAFAFMLAYLVFNVAFTLSGGTNEAGDEYVYEILAWRTHAVRAVIVVAFVAVVVLPLSFFVAWGSARLRDACFFPARRAEDRERSQPPRVDAPSEEGHGEGGEARLRV